MSSTVRTAWRPEPQSPVANATYRQQVARTRQVAAVCYRVTGDSIEFLLVRTRTGRWTFPKGRLSPSLTRSESAAREALEEAGVQGVIDSKPFASYLHIKRSGSRVGQHFEVEAFLMKVSKTGEPQEDYRDPAWVSPAEAKKYLRRSRNEDYARELDRVVDSAVHFTRKYLAKH